ncbi:MAG: transcription antitermination factor NusB [Inquilinaceae bacterium]
MADPKPSAKARRSAARLAAVQALYQMALVDAGAETVIGEFVKFRFGAEMDGDRYVEPEPMLFASIVRGVAERAKTVDEVLDGALEGPWSAERMERLLRALLRAAVWELLANEAAPARIVLSEYVAVAHAFFGGNEPSMVNAVLDKVARSLRPDELAETG